MWTNLNLQRGWYQWIMFILAISILKSLVNETLDNGLNGDYPSSTIFSSRSKEVFLRSVTIENPKDSRLPDIREAWIEKKVKTKYFLGWVPYLEASPNVYVCITFSDVVEQNNFVKDNAILEWKSLSQQTFVRFKRGTFFVEVGPTEFETKSGRIFLERVGSKPLESSIAVLSW